MNGKTPLLATGLSGLIGSRFAELYGHKFEFDTIDLTTGIDITDKAAVDKAIQQSAADILLHLAAYTNVDEAYKQQGDKQGSCYQINVIGTQNVASAAKKYNKFLIHISTDFVFDGTKNKPYHEESPTNPIEWYGTTKVMAEEVVQKTFKDGHYSIIRTSFPFRAKFAAKTDLVRKIIQGLEKDNLPPMFTDHTLTPTFIDDLCKVFFMFTLKRPRGIWHATGSSFVTDFELATIIKETYKLKGRIKTGTLQEYLEKNPRPYQKTLKISNEKLQLELGNPMLPVASALQIMKTQM